MKVQFLDPAQPLPEAWRWATIGEVARTSSGGTPSRSNAAYFGGDIPFVKIGDLNDGLITEVAENLTEEGVANSSAKLLPAGTLLMAIYGSIGKLGILGIEATTNQAICAFEPRLVERDFLYWYLRFQRDKLLGSGYGGTQDNISQKFLKPLPIPLPPRDEQRRIVEKITDVMATADESEQELRQALDLTTALRRSALYRAMIGELVPRDGSGRSIDDD